MPTTTNSARLQTPDPVLIGLGLQFFYEFDAQVQAPMRMGWAGSGPSSNLKKI